MALSEVIDAENRARDSKDKYLSALIGLQSSCEHQKIIEGEYERGVFGTTPPFRVCGNCGYAEEGWGCGYTMLNARDVDEMQRVEARSNVRGIIFPNEVHFDIRRDENWPKERNASVRRMLEQHQRVNI